MRRNLLAALGLVVLAGLACLAYLQSGKPRLVARAQGPISALAGEPGLGVAWLEATPSGDRLMLARRWRTPRLLLAGRGLTALALAEGRAFVAQRESAGGGHLLRLLPHIRKPDTLATLKGEVPQMVAGDGQIAWLEERPAALPAVPFVAAAGPVTVIRSVPQQSGAISIVEVLPAESAPTPRSSAAEGRVRLLGIAGQRVYWLEHRHKLLDTETCLISCPAAGGPATLVASEPGFQQALLLRDALVWTAYSQEASPSESHRSIKRQPLTGGAPQVIADWLAKDAVPIGDADRVYTQDPELLWRLEARRGEQRVLYSRAYGAFSAHAIGDDEYLVIGERKSWSITERPLTYWARLRHLLSG